MVMKALEEFIAIIWYYITTLMQPDCTITGSSWGNNLMQLFLMPPAQMRRYSSSLFMEILSMPFLIVHCLFYRQAVKCGLVVQEECLRLLVFNNE